MIHEKTHAAPLPMSIDAYSRSSMFHLPVAIFTERKIEMIVRRAVFETT